MSLKKIYVGATRQNDGKTAISLGLIYALSKKAPRVGFIKPVGQRYLLEKGNKIDEDSVLVKKACNLKGDLKDMSPVAIERGFTERYIVGGKKQALVEKIRESYEKIAKNKDLVVIEGTGHAGVGSVFDLSNAQVANLLNSKVVIVAEGGIGRPIDEIALNKALYEKEGVEIAGIIINKVFENKYKRIKRLVSRGLKRMDLQLFGVIPYYRVLSRPTVSQILEEEKNMKLICGEDRIDKPVEKVTVGAMEPHEALAYISNNSLVITPGDREDIMLTCMSSHLAANQTGVNISGIILTGGIKPHKSILNLIKKSGIPVLLARGDTYSVTSAIHDLIIKVRPSDKKKTEIIKKMVEKYIDLDRLYDSL
jgi:hypothetical protein